MHAAESKAGKPAKEYTRAHLLPVVFVILISTGTCAVHDEVFKLSYLLNTVVVVIAAVVTAVVAAVVVVVVILVVFAAAGAAAVCGVCGVGVCCWWWWHWCCCWFGISLLSLLSWGRVVARKRKTHTS